jgi:uncharacterized protein DUF6923
MRADVSGGAAVEGGTHFGGDMRAPLLRLCSPSLRLLIVVWFAVALPGNPAHAVTLYQTGSDGASLFVTDSANGASTYVGDFGFASTYALAFDPSDTLYAIVDGYNNGALASVDPLTGAATLVGGATGVSNLMALVFATDGTGYAASWTTDSLYAIDTTTGAVSLIGPLGFGGIMDLAFDSSGTLYGLSDSLYRIDTATGAGTLITALASGCLMGMTIDPSGNFLATDYCTGDSLFQINTSDGSLTNLGSTGVSNPMALTYRGVADQGVAVPEPETGLLVVFGLLSLALRRRVSA